MVTRDYWHFGIIVGLFLALVVQGSSCDSDFAGSNGGAGKDKFKSKDVNKNSLPLVAALECEPGTITAQVTDVDVDFDDKSKLVNLKGQFCPSAPSQLNLVFLLDTSYSLTTPEKPNDPIVDGSCARLDAVEAIIKRYQNIVDADTAEVRVTVIPFARNVGEVIEQEKATDMEDRLTTDYFCAGIKGGTNYKAVFNKAADLFEDKNGKFVTYFITDGMPTFSGDANGKNDFREVHRKAGTSAATDLRNRVGKKMILNTVYLGNDYDEVKEEFDFDFEDYLVDITGDKSRYRVAEKADDLVEKVLDIKPEPAEVENDTAEIKAQYKGGKEVGVELLSFREHSDKASTWVFETSPIPLFNDEDKLEKVIIEAANDDGEQFRVKINVKGRDGSSGSDEEPEEDEESADNSEE